MNIIIYTDSVNSWFVPYGNKLKKALLEQGHSVKYVYKSQELYPCDIMFLLSCTKLLSRKYLQPNKNNIVVHASDLPHGKGFSPMQWQILEGKNQIPITLFEAVEGVDSGPFYLKDMIEFEGHELLNELREKMALKIIQMCLRFVNEYGKLRSQPQIGESSLYKKRMTQDDQLDISKSIASQFNHFRIAHNENHPLYFKYLGHKYYLKIIKESN
ncbi:formyltransferase family protein [Christiangramia sp.]|uniref:formyltransferase family protein n=1 Tax=Christiangramia sp. TaxID=1931228 RepID=UPI00260220FB|nr:formyltransferase family protein [Christiangramia sp.]